MCAMYCIGSHRHIVRLCIADFFFEQGEAPEAPTFIQLIDTLQHAVQCLESLSFEGLKQSGTACLHELNWYS